MAKKGIKTSITRNPKALAEAKRVTNILRSKGAILVGIPKDAPPYDDGTSVAEIGAKNEFGIGVPERSFLRSTFKEKKAEYQDKIADAVVDAIKGKSVLKKSLQKIGNQASSDVKNKIVNLREPANSQSTINAKGTSNPLIESGHMKNSVTYEVID